MAEGQHIMSNSSCGLRPDITSLVSADHSPSALTSSTLIEPRPQLHDVVASQGGGEHACRDAAFGGIAGGQQVFPRSASHHNVRQRSGDQTSEFSRGCSPTHLPLRARSQIAGKATLEEDSLSLVLPSHTPKDIDDAAHLSETSTFSGGIYGDCGDPVCTSTRIYLKQKIQQLDHLVSSYRRLYSTTEDEKAQEILRLQKQLKERGTMAQITTEEVERLKTSLSETSQLCHSLQCKINCQNICQDASAEVIRLRQSLNDAVGANKRWQTYNSQREQFVAHTQKKMADLESEIQQLRSRPVFNEHQQRDIDELLLKSKRKAEEAEEAREKLADEVTLLKRELLQRNTAVRHTEDHVALLRAQVVAYSRDFQVEKAQNEYAQAKVAELQNLLENIRRKDLCGRPNMTYQYHDRRTLLARGPTFSPLSDKVESDSNGENIQDSTNGNSLQEGGNDDVNVSNEPLSSKHILEKSDTSGAYNVSNGSAESNASLRCPKCWKQYQQWQHAEMLEHMEVCTM